MLEALWEFYHLYLGLYIYLKLRMMYESASLFSHVYILYVHMYVLVRVRGEIPQMPTSSQIGLKEIVYIRRGNCICEHSTDLS